MPPPDGQPRSAQELVAEQRRREAVERERAVAAPDEHAAHQHARRAEQAAYLRAKLEDRVESERERDG